MILTMARGNRFRGRGLGSVENKMYRAQFLSNAAQPYSLGRFQRDTSDTVIVKVCANFQYGVLI